MTAEELNKRYKPNKALALSIEKWTRAGYPENWEQVMEGGFLERDTCSLCRKTCITLTGCDECCISERDNTEKDEYYGCPTSYHNAYEAAVYKDRPAFMKARKVLLARMKRAYDRGER
jgi:hypothetical protein